MGTFDDGYHQAVMGGTRKAVDETTRQGGIAGLVTTISRQSMTKRTKTPTIIEAIKHKSLFGSLPALSVAR
jgi:hypothetical protein